MRTRIDREQGRVYFDRMQVGGSSFFGYITSGERDGMNADTLDSSGRGRCIVITLPAMGLTDNSFQALIHSLSLGIIPSLGREEERRDPVEDPFPSPRVVPPPSERLGWTRKE